MTLNLRGTAPVSDFIETPGRPQDYEDMQFYLQTFHCQVIQHVVLLQIQSRTLLVITF